MSFQCEKCFTCFTTSYLYNKHMGRKTSCYPKSQKSKSIEVCKPKSSDITELKNMVLDLQNVISNYASTNNIAMINNPTVINNNITTTNNNDHYIMINAITKTITIRSVKSVTTDKKLISN
jgi:hypothetical protein